MSVYPDSRTGQAPSIADVVREATGAASRRAKDVGFAFAKASPAEKFVAPLLGIYLGWAVARLPEIFPAFAIPRLPMILMILFLLLLAVAIPFSGWAQTWRNSLALRLACIVCGIAIVTVPLGIWMSGSFNFLKDRYSIAFIIFLSCLFFLRDRKSLRVAVMLFVLCTTAISTKLVMTWDPDQLVETESGELVPMSELRADYQRMNISASLDPNDYGAVIATAVPLALWLSFGGFWRRIVWGAASLILIASVVPTASRGAMVGLAAVALTLVAFGAKGWKRIFLLVVIVAGGLLFSAIATQGQMDRFLDFGTDDYNLTNEGRWYFWRQGIVWMIKRPWGYGIANFPTYFDWLNGQGRAAHSSWVQYGMELGVAGLVTFILLNVALWRGHKRNRAIALSLPTRERKLAESESVLSGHMLAMMAGTLVTGSFLSNGYYPLMYMMLGIAAASLLGSPFGPQSTDVSIFSDRFAKRGAPGLGTANPATAPTGATRGVTRLSRRR